MEDQLKALMEHIAEDDRRFIMTIHLYTYHIDEMGFGRMLWDSTKEESYYDKDNALSRLFDLDLFGWQLKSLDWGFDYGWIPTYSVSMWKYASSGKNICKKNSENYNRNGSKMLNI